MCASQHLKNIFVFKTLNDILYIKFINEFFQHHSKYNNSYPPKTNKNPTYTSNLHDNAPLPLFT